MIFRLYILYNKHKMIKIGTQNRELSQVLSQVLEYFFGGVYVRYITFSIILKFACKCAVSKTGGKRKKEKEETSQ